MNSFGANLKREREARGISLQEISHNTKIGVRLLKAIEDEQLDQLPGGIFDKSFLRQYARYLGLDEDQILSEYLRAIGAATEPPPALPSTFEEKSVPFPADSGYRGGYIRLVLTAVLVGGAVAGAFYGIREFAAKRAARSAAARSEAAAQEPPPAVGSAPINSPDTTAAPAPDQTAIPGPPSVGATGPVAPTMPFGTAVPRSASPKRAIEKPQPAAPPASSPIEKAAPSAAANPAAEAAAPDAPALVLQIEARKECWVSISADGQKQWQGTLLAASSRRVQARDSFLLTIGDAGAVTLTLNGKSLSLAGHSGEVKTLTITAKGLAQPEP